MRQLTLILFCLTTNMVVGQTFKNDWTTFSAKNWVTEYGSDTTSYLFASPVGKMVFRNKMDNTLKVQYYVFDKSKIDSTFLRKKQEWEFVQSCGVMTDGKTNFTSFELGQFYYLLKTCHNCNTGLSEECQILSSKLSSFAKNNY